MAYKLGNVQESVILGYWRRAEREGEHPTLWRCLVFDMEKASVTCRCNTKWYEARVADSTPAVKGTGGNSDLLLHLD